MPLSPSTTQPTATLPRAMRPPRVTLLPSAPPLAEDDGYNTAADETRLRAGRNPPCLPPFRRIDAGWRRMCDCSRPPHASAPSRDRQEKSTTEGSPPGLCFLKAT